MEWIIGIIALSLVIAVIAFGARPLATKMQANEAEEAIRQFRIRREQLEAKFFELASQAGKPRGVRWKECDWQDQVAFARDRETGMITAFASVNVSFEAVEGSDMEEVEHVGLLRDGCAVFHHESGVWGTGGRVLFNMNPSDAVERFGDNYEEVGRV